LKTIPQSYEIFLLFILVKEELKPAKYNKGARQKLKKRKRCLEIFLQKSLQGRPSAQVTDEVQHSDQCSPTLSTPWYRLRFVVF